MGGCRVSRGALPRGEGRSSPHLPPLRCVTRRGQGDPPKELSLPSPGYPEIQLGTSGGPSSPRTTARLPSIIIASRHEGRSGKGAVLQPPRLHPSSWGIKPPSTLRGYSPELVLCWEGLRWGSPLPPCRGTEPRTPPAHPLHPWQVKPTRGNAPLYPAVGSHRGFGVRCVTQPHQRVGLQWGGG